MQMRASTSYASRVILILNRYVSNKENARENFAFVKNQDKNPSMLAKFYMPFAHEFTRIKKRNRIYLTIWAKNSKGKKEEKIIIPFKSYFLYLYLLLHSIIFFNLNASSPVILHKCANKTNVIQFQFNLKVN